jgi:hypothetical protein
MVLSVFKSAVLECSKSVSRSYLFIKFLIFEIFKTCSALNQSVVGVVKKVCLKVSYYIFHDFDGSVVCYCIASV